MYFSRIKLTNWKNFRDADASLRHRVFIIGPNAAGKSNFLDALRFLMDVAGSGFHSAVASRGGVGSIRCLAARQSSEIRIEAEISEDDSGGGAWQYDLEFNQDQQRKPRIKREVVRRRRDGQWAEVLTRPDSDDEADPLRMSQTALEQINANTDFRVLADFFRTISYRHLVPQVVRDPRGFSGTVVQNDPFGRDFLARLWGVPKTTRDARLRRISRVLKKAVPQLEDLGVEMDTAGVPHLIGRYSHWRPHAARQDETKLSDGTLRLIGLLWSVFDGQGPLLLEEPELSLHIAVVETLPAMFAEIQREHQKMKREPVGRRRQILVSTHSEALLQDKSIGPDEVLSIEPSHEGSRILAPTVHERSQMANGLTVSDVLLAKTAEQLRLAF